MLQDSCPVKKVPSVSQFIAAQIRMLQVSNVIFYDSKATLFFAAFCYLGMGKGVLCLLLILITSSCRGVRAPVITEKTELLGGLYEEGVPQSVLKTCPFV